MNAWAVEAAVRMPPLVSSSVEEDGNVGRAGGNGGPAGVPAATKEVQVGEATVLEVATIGVEVPPTIKEVKVLRATVIEMQVATLGVQPRRKSKTF